MTPRVWLFSCEKLPSKNRGVEHASLNSGATITDYASGHEGDSALAGFAVRGSELVVYIAAGFEGRDVLLAKLESTRLGRYVST